MLSFWWLSGLTGPLRLLVPALAQRVAVRARAEQSFVEQGVTETREQQRTAEIDGERPEASKRQRDRRRRDRFDEFLPGRPQRRQARHQDDQRQGHAKAGAAGRRPTDGQRDQEVDRRVLEEIDAVGEQRDRADPHGNRELDAEIGEVEQRDRDDGPPQRLAFYAHLTDLRIITRTSRPRRL